MQILFLIFCNFPKEPAAKKLSRIEVMVTMPIANIKILLLGNAIEKQKKIVKFTCIV